MFVTEEINERLLMLHRHSRMPPLLCKYRDAELRKMPKEVRPRYLNEVNHIYEMNRRFIDQYLQSNLSKERKPVLDMMYASRALALNKQTLEYI